jgi:hypothetical protein
VQAARALKMNPTNVHIKVTAQYARKGSVLQGSAESWCDSLTTELALECDDTPERIAHLIKMAEATCYTLGTLRRSVPAALVALVNDQPFDVEAPT